MTIEEAAEAAGMSYQAAYQILIRLERQGTYRATRQPPLVVDEEFVRILKSRRGKRGRPRNEERPPSP